MKRLILLSIVALLALSAFGAIIDGIPNTAVDRAVDSATADVGEVQTALDVAEASIANHGQRILDTEQSLLENWILDAFNNDMDSVPGVDGYCVNFNSLVGIDQDKSTNVTFNGTGDFITNQIYSAVGSPEKIHLKMNDSAASTTVTDDGDFNDGAGGITSSVNTVTLSTSGKIGNAFLFNGSTNAYYLRGGYDSSADTGQGTWAMWLKSSVNTVHYPVSFGNADGDRDLNLQTEDNTYYGTRFGGIAECILSSAASRDLQNGSWFHFAVVQDGASENVIYTNGVLWADGYDHQNSTWVDDIANEGYEEVMVGARLRGSGGAPNGPFDGAIDDFRVYTNALTQTEINTLYNSGNGTESSLATYSGGDMWVTSSNQVFASNYQDCNVRILYKEGTNATLNTNYKFWISNDGGSTSNLVTLTDAGEYRVGSGINWLTGTNYFAASSNDFVWTLFSAQGAGSTYSVGYTLNE